MAKWNVPVVLPGNPTNPLEATPKQYVDTGLATKAPVNNAALTGVPTAPTAAVADNTTQIATTAFARQLINNYLATHLTIGGDLLPVADNVQSLGSPEKMWKDVYIGPGSLYLNGQKVLEDTESGTIVMRADPGQNISVQTFGTGDVELAPQGSGLIQLKGNVMFDGASQVRSSDGLPILFDDSIEFTPGAGLIGAITIDGQTAWHAGNFLPSSKLDATATAAAASRLFTARTFALTGLITASAVSFDGTANVSLSTAIADGALLIAKTGGLQAALDAKINSSQIGIANGVAGLGADGKIPTAQLPSYVDDVLEFANLAALPGTGETGKMYVTLNDNKIFRWSGSVYINISSAASTADTATRWATARTITLTGKASGGVSLDGSADVSLNVSGLNGVKGDVGLGNVDNTSDINKPVSTAQAAADNLRVAKTGDVMSGNLAIGTGTAAVTALDVKNTAFDQLRLSNSSQQKLWMGAVADTVGTYIGHNAKYASSLQYTPDYIAASGIQFDQNGPIYFWGNTGLTAGVNFLPTARMTILPTGNVGIGTTNPTARLHIDQGNQVNTPMAKITNIGQGNVGFQLAYATGGWLEVGGQVGSSIQIAATNRTMAFSVAGNAYDASPQSFLFSHDQVGRKIAVVRGMAGQTANPFEVQNSASAAMFSVDPIGNAIAAGQLRSGAAQGTAPLVVASTTLVANLNADYLEGQHGSYYQDLTNSTGVLSGTKGGTGLGDVAVGNYLRGTAGDAMEERTPTQVRGDIAAKTFTASTTAPVNPNNGDEWLNKNNGIKYTWYVDDDSSQWVQLEAGGTTGSGGGESGGGGSANQFYAQPTQPVDENPYIWLETGLGSEGTDFTMWFNVPD